MEILKIKLEQAKDRFIDRHFGTAYLDRFFRKKVLTLFYDEGKWYLLSQYTGALYDVSLKGFREALADFKL